MRRRSIFLPAVGVCVTRNGDVPSIYSRRWAGKRRRRARSGGKKARWHAFTLRTPTRWLAAPLQNLPPVQRRTGDEVRRMKRRGCRLHVDHGEVTHPADAPGRPPVDRVWIECAGGKNTSRQSKNKLKEERLSEIFCTNAPNK
jgi:hypothetical protein